MCYRSVVPLATAQLQMACSVQRRLLLVAAGTLWQLLRIEAQTCGKDTIDKCCGYSSYNCSLPGLQGFRAGQYSDLRANYLSFNTQGATPTFKARAAEFRACTGGEIVFAEADNVWEDPIKDLGTKDRAGLGVYHGYFMSYSHFPEASALGLAERLDTRLEQSNYLLQWETVFPKVKLMGQYRRNGENHLDFLMYDGDFFVPLIRLDLLERDNIPLPNTWDELIDVARHYHNKDLNDDGVADYGFCHFPREGAGFLDWWRAEEIYATWATHSQTQGTSQGFLFHPETMEPLVTGSAFRKAASVWKELWTMGAEGCITDNFITGRCAVGFSPPGCWKGIFLNGVSRKDSMGNVVWQPRMKDGSYAEPYRFKPFGSTQVEVDGSLVDCSPSLCPLAEAIPEKGHHGSADRAAVLPQSPLKGKLINRVPFYWSGGLGTMIRKSAPENIKNLMWDFFVYTNSPQTSNKDVACCPSWLDSWRMSQLSEGGQEFLAAGWSRAAYTEHRAIMHWALADGTNGGLNLRLPGAKQYTFDVLASEMAVYIADNESLDTLVSKVHQRWQSITETRGFLDQLSIYRATLGLNQLSEVDLCKMYRERMDAKDPTVCRKYDDTAMIITYVLAGFSGLLTIACLIAGAVWVVRTARMKQRLWREKEQHLDQVVQEGLGTTTSMGYPMVLISAVNFLALSMDDLQTLHEGLRDMGRLVMLDTLEDVRLFHAAGRKFVFFSYHWPSWFRKGPDQIQRTAMDHALQLYSENTGKTLEDIFVWLDIISIPQRHPGVQQLAINSLYVYASQVDTLVIIAPKSKHADTGELLGLESYKSRAWTRVEQFAHVCHHGMQNAFIYTPDGLECLTKEWIRDVVCIFEGQLTCCRRKHDFVDKCDRESLVLPLLGLYYRICSAEKHQETSNDGIKTLYEIISSSRERVFPTEFEFVKEENGCEVRSKRVFFGDLLQRVDKRLAAGRQSIKQAKRTSAADQANDSIEDGVGVLFKPVVVAPASRSVAEAPVKNGSLDAIQK